ncbi:MAG: T9SS type A sorting domain-containing protein [Candidatus Coatesbacteria bacterium]|nr:T9SS type A sorting domain-containing protein [Candidatus Coatesbacteria bacterium]
MFILILFSILNTIYPDYLGTDNNHVSIDRYFKYWCNAENIGIIYSTNAGSSWEFIPLNINPYENTNLYGIINLETGYLTGASINSSFILRTNNLNSQWEKAYTFERGKTWRSPAINPRFFFIDNQLGFSYTQYDVAKTTDSGRSWKQVYHLQQNVTFLDLQFINAEKGWFIDTNFGYASQDTLVSTTDGGETWMRLPLPETGWDFQFIDENNGLFISIASRKIYETSDGGYQWNYLTSIPDINSPNNLVMRNKKEAWFTALNENEEIFVYHTIDGGHNWEGTQLERGFGSTLFVFEDSVIQISPSCAYITKDGIHWQRKRKGISFNNSSYSPTVKVFRNNKLSTYKMDIGSYSYYISTDKGYNWETVKCTSNYSLIDSFEGNNDNIWIGAMNFPSASSAIIRSTDSGNSWEEYQTQWKDRCHLWGLEFIDDNRGILSCGYENRPSASHLSYTSDSGRTWTEVERPAKLSYPKDIFFFENGTAYVLDELGVSIGKSTDYGHSWSDFPFPEQISSFNAFFALTPDTLFIAYDNLLKSFDGGKSWTMLPLKGLPFDSILFKDSLHGAAICRHDSKLWFYHTQDGGGTWSKEALFHDNYPKMRLNNGVGSQIIISGAGGLLMSWDWETGFSDNRTAVSIIPPKKSRILSIYPNPVLDRTSSYIKYELSNDSQVELNCYDITGRYIGKIFEGNRKQGRYITGINNRLNLSHGVYIIELIANHERSDVKKIVVMK